MHAIKRTPVFIATAIIMAAVAIAVNLAAPSEALAVSLGVTGTKILSKTKLSDEYSPYYQMGPVQKPQTGVPVTVVSGTQREVKYSLSVGLSTPIPVLSSSIKTSFGYSVSNTTVKLSGMTTWATAKKPYVRPYARESWHRVQVVEEVTERILSGRSIIVVTKKVTSIVKIPFVDSQATRWGYAATKAELPATIYGNASHPLFVK